MKKTFELTHPRIQYARRVEAVKNEIRKYIKRERNKSLPEDVDFWDFDCKFGDTEAEAKSIHLSEIDKRIDGAVAKELMSFYVEILSKPRRRLKKVDVNAEVAAKVAAEAAEAKLKAAARPFKSFSSQNSES